MDLRQLRHRPESELARFKNRLKQIVQRLRYVGWVLFGVSLLISFVLFFMFDLSLMPPKQEAPIKRYGTVFPSQQERVREEISASESPQVVTDSTMNGAMPFRFRKFCQTCLKQVKFGRVCPTRPPPAAAFSFRLRKPTTRYLCQNLKFS